MAHPFHFEPLWNKAKVFIERGLVARADNREEEWALWASLAAELLGKAALAKRHPVLVAHPGTGEDAGNSLLSAAGIQGKDEGLQSITMKTVLLRLERILPAEFDKDVRKDMALVSRLRNEDLHSGSTPFTGLKEHSWAPGFWRGIDILLRDIGKAVTDFVGPDFTAGVTEQIASMKEEVVREVNKRFGSAKGRWEQLTKGADAQSLQEEAGRKASAGLAHTHGIIEKCPVCGSAGLLIHGNVLLSESRRVEHDQVRYDHRYRVEKFSCRGCGLELDGTAMIVRAKLSVDIALTEDFSQEWEPDYGND
jgi:hypothetical protein